MVISMPSHFATAGRAVHPGPAATCPACNRIRQARRPSRQQRGYDTTYDTNRKVTIQAALDAADNGTPVTCSRCPHPCLRGQNLTADHLKALRDGGTNDLGNLAPCHAACNYGWNRGRR